MCDFHKTFQVTFGNKYAHHIVICLFKKLPILFLKPYICKEKT